MGRVRPGSGIPLDSLKLQKHVWGIILLVGTGVGLFLGPQHVFAQACKDEETMVEGSRQALVELPATVKKESLAEFQTLNQQKSAVNKLALHDSVLGELIDCLDKVAHDATASKEAVAAASAERDASIKLREKIKLQEGAIKDAKVPKDAKAVIEKLDLTP
jgi:hypothetical protein